MAKERLDFSGVPQEIRGGGKGRLPEGDHLVKITKVEKKWKDNDKSNIPYFNWTLQAVDGQHKGKVAYQITSLATDALFNLRNLIYACTKKNVAGKSLNFDPQALVGKRLAITTQDEEWKSGGKSGISSRVVDMRPADELDQGEDDDEDTESSDEEVEEVEEEDLEDVDLDEL